MTLEFDDSVKGNLANYREEDGWPIFIDEFVNFVKNGNKIVVA